MQRRLSLLRNGVLGALIVAGILAGGGTAASAMAFGHGGDKSKCRREVLSTRLSASDPHTYKIVGDLCWRGALQGKTVQVLISGFTYGSSYWDFPVQPDTYSYVQSATKAGYATFNYDRTGIGRSDHPADPDAVTMSAEASVTHQIVQDLRNGQVGHTPFSTVMLVAHSLGSGIAVEEASAYHDVDGVILTGFASGVNEAGSAAVLATYRPANRDLKFVHLHLADGYLTTQVGTRGTSFYNTRFASPLVILADELLKQDGTTGEQATFGESLNPDLSRQIQVPVLLANGEKDSFFCDANDPSLSCADATALKDREVANYAPEVCLETFVLPHAGHVANLHPNAPQLFAFENNWANRRVGSVAHPATQPCQP